jgi:nitrate reductase NapAB chaperone NapD
MTIASWLVDVEPGRGNAVRAALLANPGIECRSEARGTIVVLSESPSRPGVLDGVLTLLATVPGVRQASLVTSFEYQDDSTRSVAEMHEATQSVAEI